VITPHTLTQVLSGDRSAAAFLEKKEEEQKAAAAKKKLSLQEQVT
jgi:hypothetical protein